MEYRNSGNATHHVNGLAAGVGSSHAVELGGGSTAGTITAISDDASANLSILAKGTGNLRLGDSSNAVYLNGSTTAFKIVVGESTMTAPAMAANSQAESTFTATGISTGDIVLSVDFRNTLSTSYLPGYAYVGAADKIHVPLGNVHASTISASTGVTVRWMYLDRTP